MSASTRLYLYLGLGLLLAAIISMALDEDWAGNSAAQITPDEPERFIHQNTEMV